MKFYLKITIVLFAAILYMHTCVTAQSSYLTLGGKEEWLLNRLDIKTKNRQLSFSAAKPFDRRILVKEIDIYDSLYNTGNAKTKPLSEVDKYNMQRFLMSNSEWSKPKEMYKSEQPFLKSLYTNRANMVDLKDEDYTFIVNPIINYQQGSKAGNPQSTFVNQRGINARGTIGSSIGFHFYFTENQERQATYVQEWRDKFAAFPGAGYLKSFKVNGNDYFDIRGGLTWKVAKFMNMQLAYDRNVIGHGFRSLFLSDFSTNYMYLKVNTHFGKFRYQNIFAEMVGFRTRGGDRIYPRKYMRASYLNFAATKWLNLGLFESLTLGERTSISLPLFNPIMFTNVSNNQNDKALIGFDVKANLLKKVQVYGQFIVDKINTNELVLNSWANRFGYQLGAKYVDAFGIKNLDAQVETNMVRPFMYASTDSFSSYNHYNQPLAHPLGANFNEYIAILRYQPIKKLYLESKILFYQQGLDSSIAGVNQNFGSNIFNFHQTRTRDIGFTTTSGDLAKCTIFTFLASYEFKENIFFDLSYLYRNFDRQTSGRTFTTLISAGVRMNIGRREFLF